MTNLNNISINSKIESRPLLKGYSHFFAFLYYMLNYKSMVRCVPISLKSVIKFYLLTILAHFGCSAFLHIINWPKRWVIYPRRLDHVVIFFKIIATYYVAISTVITDINPIVLQVVKIGTILGIISRIFFTDAPTWFIALPYFIVGWAILLDPSAILSLITRLPMGSLICLLGGIMYSFGGYIYIRKSPNILPKYIEYHELFHLFSILGTCLFVRFVFKHAIPYYLKLSC